MRSFRNAIFGGKMQYDLLSHVNPRLTVVMQQFLSKDHELQELKA